LAPIGIIRDGGHRECREDNAGLPLALGGRMK